MAKKTAVLVLGAYVALRMLPDAWFWRGISVYWSYAFEVVFVGAVARGLRQWPKFALAKADLGWGGAALLGGAVVQLAARRVGIPIPFNLSDGETRVLLLVVAPVLEELIFRGALWESVYSVCRKNTGATVLASALLFAVGHFQAYWFVPEELRRFVLYQTAYVFVLGVCCGVRRGTGSVGSAVVTHFGFNAGFFLAG